MSESDGGPKCDDSCTLCQDCGDTGDGANFCTACGRQLKPVSNRRLKCRSAESSEQTAWRVFGFANASSTERTPGKTPSGTTAYVQNTEASLRSTGIKAVKAIRKKIVKDCAPATSDQARVMGVEPVVERMGLDLSIEQLRVLALARSSALYGRRRRHPPSRFQEQRLVLAATNPISKQTAGAEVTLQDSNSGRLVERRVRTSKTSFERSSSCNCFSGRGGKNKRSRRGDRNPADRNRVSREVSLNTTPRASHQRGASSSKHNRSSTTAADSIEQLRQREPETREQVLAMAQGGLRYRQMVFHRKGFRLNDGSPRGVRPREAFRKPGFHPLCSKEIVVAGADGGNEVFTAILSAIVRIMETKNTSASEDVDTPRLDLRGQINARSPHGVPHNEVYGCEGLRLEVRPKRPRDTSTDKMTSDTFDTSSMPPGSTGHTRGTNHIFRRGVMRNLVVGSQENENDRKGDDDCSVIKDSRSIEDCPDQDQSMALRGGLPRAATLSTRARRLDSGKTNDAPFVEDLLHSEIGALLGRTFLWSDPFEEEKTVDELKGTWTACLEALCRRLRITIIFPEVRDGHNSPSCTNAEAMPPEALPLETLALVASKPSALAPVTRAPVGSPANDCNTPREKIVGRDYPPLSPTNDGAIVGIVTPARSEYCVYGGLELENNHIPEGCDTSVCNQDAGHCILDHAAREGPDRAMVCFDKVLVRVGVRVPWGRRKRKRFAKVLFAVSLGEGCRGLDFLAVSLSPSGDPMLRGRWECHATDRDLARFLNTGLVSLAGQDPREGTVRVYDPKRCAAELQECGELERACMTLVQQAFSLVLTVPGGVSLYFAGLIEHAGREVAWPQDIEEDRILREASTHVQRIWRGWSSRKRALWLRMEREGRRRLARLQEELKYKRSLEARANALQTERRIRAQIVLAAGVRGRMARLEAARQRARRAEEHLQSEDPGADRSESTGEEVTSTPITYHHKRHEMEHEGDERRNEESSPLGILGRDSVHFEKDVTIDGTEVRLMADVKEAGGTANGRARVAEEMKLLAVDKKSRKSTTLTLEAADIRDIVGPVDRPTSASGGGWNGGAGALEAFAAVLKILTVFRSHRKDLFILSYKGKKVMAPH